jgi:TonB family protein
MKLIIAVILAAVCTVFLAAAVAADETPVDTTKEAAEIARTYLIADAENAVRSAQAALDYICDHRDALADRAGKAAFEAADAAGRPYSACLDAGVAAAKAIIADYAADVAAARDALTAARDAARAVLNTTDDEAIAAYNARCAAIAARGTTPPEKVSSTEPVCPPALKEEGWSGSCSIGLYIDESGNVGKVWVIRSTGKPEADQAALAAAQASQWRPATQNGVPIAEKVSITYEF